MATLADSLVASSSRPLDLQVRADLVARRHRYQGRSYWVVKEPIGLKYYRFQDEEYAVLRMLKEGASLEEVKTQFETEFAPHKITYQDLQQFIGTLHRSGLVVSKATGQGVQLKKRRDERIRKERLASLSNILAIRFKGIDPERILNTIYPVTRWLFSPITAMIFAMFGIGALLLIGAHFDVFRSRLPEFEQFFGPKNWYLLAMVLAVTKIMHEFGHGLLCRHFGGECHEMGIMMLVLTPCLYCNVSDSWMLPSKWQRAAIGAGGIYVELILATIGTYVWWFSEPGLLNHIALRVMFICSVSTVLFNGNPLLRFDGYYILADLMEIPNMRQKASSILQKKAGEICLGLEMPEDPFLPQGNQWLFALYTIAAVAYRWVVFFSILFFLNKVFEPYGLKIIGQLLAVMGLFGLVVQPLWQLGKFMHQPGRMDQVKWPRFYATVAVAVALVVGVLMIPFPRNVKCGVQIQPADAFSVFVDVPGRLTELYVSTGDQVEKDQPLAKLENPELEMRINEIESQQKDYEIQLEDLKRQRSKDPTSRTHMSQIVAQIESKKRELQEKMRDVERLTLRAAVAGFVLSPPLRPERPSPDGQLVSWSGSPFDKKNMGMTLEVSDMICQIADPKKVEAILTVDQTDIEDVHEGQNVRIRLEALTNQTFKGQISEISKRDMQEAPASWGKQAGGEVDTRTDASGRQVPVNTIYQARVPLNNDDLLMLMQYRGKAKIKVSSRTLYERLVRYLSRTFHFDI